MKTFIQKHKRSLTGAGAVLAVALLLPNRASALFGIGDIVFDPVAVAKLIEQYTQQIQQYTRQGLQLAQEVFTAANTLNHYKLAIQQAQFFTNKQFWLAVSKALWRDQASNTLGETAQWNLAINGAPQIAPSAWISATTSVGDTKWMSGLTVGTSPNVSDLATVEIADATGINTLRTLADFRNSQNSNQDALEKLESDALDDSDATNVQVRQLNLEAAGTVQMLRNQQNMIDVMGYQLEQQMIVNKPTRDGIAATLSRYSAMNSYQKSEPTAIASPQATFSGFQVP